MWNKDYHNTPFGQKGGLATYVVAGVVSGCELSLGGTANDGIDAGDATIAEVVISAGQVRYDGQLIKIASPITGSIQTESADLSAETDFIVQVYLNPTRIVPASETAPLSPSTDDMYLKVRLVNDTYFNYGKMYYAEDILKYNGVGWERLDPLKDIRNDPTSFGWNNMLWNKIDSTLTAANVSGENELPVFMDHKMPPHISNQGLPLIRQSAGILLGEVTFTGGTGTITKTLAGQNRLPV